jgi:dienelactone hydrolase|tara:strand:- start:1914 stop:2354 length:441 start_codon:yes stop_codon:yes gene_type:complete
MGRRQTTRIMSDNKDILNESQISTEIKEEFDGSQMTKAGRLAMELNRERKRLKQELAEMQIEVEDLKPATPTGTVDSYVKWCATILGVVGVFIMSAGFSTAGQICYALAAGSWVYVGHCWNDKAIMIGSAISGTAVLMNLVEIIVN